MRLLRCARKDGHDQCLLAPLTKTCPTADIHQLLIRIGSFDSETLKKPFLDLDFDLDLDMGSAGGMTA